MIATLSISFVTPAVAGPEITADQASASFSQSTYTVTRGDTIDIGYAHSTDATLIVGGDDMGYELHVATSGSGSSSVSIDTYESTSANPGEYVSGGSPTLVTPSSGGLDQVLVPGEYTLEIQIDGTTRDIAVLEIEPRPSIEMEALVAPGETDLSETNQETLLSRATTRRTVAKGDIALLKFEMPGLEKAVDENVLDGTAAGDGIRVHFDDLNPPQNKPEDSFDATQRESITTFWSEESAELVVAWETDDVRLYDDRHRYNVSVAINGSHNELVEGTSVEDSTVVKVVEKTATLGIRDEIVIEPWDSTTLQVNGTTNAAPNTELDIRVRGAVPRPFLETTTATVASNGTFETAFDVSPIPPNHRYPLFVLDHKRETERTLIVHGSNATFDFSNQTIDKGGALEMNNVSLDAGGYVVAGHWSGNNTTEIVGTSRLLDPGTHTNVTIPLQEPLNDSTYLSARAYMDRDENESLNVTADVPYLHNGSAFEQTAVVWVEPADENTTVTTTTTQPPPTTTTISVESPPPLTPNETNTSMALPLWVPILALVSSGFILRRRR